MRTSLPNFSRPAFAPLDEAGNLVLTEPFPEPASGPGSAVAPAFAVIATWAVVIVGIVGAVLIGGAS